MIQVDSISRLEPYFVLLSAQALPSVYSKVRSVPSRLIRNIDGRAKIDRDRCPLWAIADIDDMFGYAAIAGERGVSLSVCVL